MEEQEERERDRQTEDRTDSFCERKKCVCNLTYSVENKYQIEKKTLLHYDKVALISYSTYGSCGFYVNK